MLVAPKDSASTRIAPIQRGWSEAILIAPICATIIALYAIIGNFDRWQSGAKRPEDAYYNLLVRGFQAGQLDLKIKAPPALLQLPDPYDPVVNAPFRLRLHDTSLYRGKIYLYFGPTPALVLFWPFQVLTGEFLWHKDAVIIFCALGYLASIALLCSIRHRYFPEAHFGVLAGAALALGATGLPVLLGRADVWEVPISCGYALLMLCLLAIWEALHRPNRRTGLLLIASLLYGLALGARPALLFGAVVLLAAPLYGWRIERPSWPARLRWFTAAIAPITVIGLGLLAYNYLRFDDPLEFGQRYQLAGDATPKIQLFSPRYLWTNIHAYFLSGVEWGRTFPFVHHTKTESGPDGHLAINGTFGILLHLPFLWLATVIPLAWRRPTGAWRERGRPLRWFAAFVALLFLMVAGTVCFFAGACDRYEIEFLPPLLLLSALGLLTLPSLIPSSKTARVGVHATWVALLAGSALFSVLASYKFSAPLELFRGNVELTAGRFSSAIVHFKAALAMKPQLASAHEGLGVALVNSGQLEEGVAHLEQAIALQPDYALAHSALGQTFIAMGRLNDAREHLQEAVKLAPYLGAAHQGLGRVFMREGQMASAVKEFEIALSLDPDLQRLRPELEMARRALGQQPSPADH